MCGSGSRQIIDTDNFRGKLSTEHRAILDNYVSESGVDYLVDGAAETSTASLSLKYCCRISIRRCIGSAHPFGSLTYEVLVLYRDGILPKKLVSFFLFRDEPIPRDLRYFKW
jgi:hypothetical protein